MGETQDLRRRVLRKVAIIGLGPSREHAPMDWETWGLPWDAYAPRYDLLFEMHARETLGIKRQERLKELDVPIYMQEQHEDIPASREYPLEEVSQSVRDYYGSSIAYMVALAIVEGVDEIGLWGVDLEGSYDHQRPNLEYLIGYAEGLGIPVTIPEMSNLLRVDNAFKTGEGVKVFYPRRYGFVNGHI